MFRAALEDATVLSAYQVVRGDEIGHVTVFNSDYLFLGLALAFPLVAVAAIFVMMLGWWELGRKVSLSPVETAKAFGAPVLADAGSNEDIKTMLKGRGIKYLEVQYGDNGRNQLEIGPRESIVRPRVGHRFE